MSSVNIGVLISGSGTNLQSIIDNIDTGYINGSIKVVISNKKNAYGLVRAEKKGIDNIFIDKSKYQSTEDMDKAIIKELQDRDVELVVLAGYINILSEGFVECYKNRIINIHPSLIPSFCGKGFYGIRVHRAVVDYGVKVTGATVHFVDKGTDTGAIILQDTADISPKDTPEDVQQKVLKIEHRLLPKAVKLYCDGKIKLDGRKVILE